MSIYLDEKNPGKHKPFEDASPDKSTWHPLTNDLFSVR